MTCPGGTRDELPWDIQTNAKGNIVAHLRDSPVAIYQQSALTAVCPDDPTYTVPTAACCAFLATDWLYKGTVDAVSTISLSYGSGPGSFVLSMVGHGNVYDPFGNWYRYTDRQMARLDPKGNWIGWTHERVRVF